MFFTILMNLSPVLRYFRHLYHVPICHFDVYYVTIGKYSLKSCSVDVICAVMSPPKVVTKPWLTVLSGPPVRSCKNKNKQYVIVRSVSVTITRTTRTKELVGAENKKSIDNGIKLIGIHINLYALNMFENSTEYTILIHIYIRDWLSVNKLLPLLGRGAVYVRTYTYYQHFNQTGTAYRGSWRSNDSPQYLANLTPQVKFKIPIEIADQADRAWIEPQQSGPNRHYWCRLLHAISKTYDGS